MNPQSLLAVSLLFLSVVGHADLESGDADLSAGSAQLADQLAVSNTESQADIQAQQQICDADPSGEACQSAQERVTRDVAQIHANTTLAQQVNAIFGSSSTAQAIAQRQTKTAGLRSCLYSAMVACSLLHGGGDLTQTSLSGKGVGDEQMPQTPIEQTISGSAPPP